MSKISIALCTYNGAEFLPAQLESFRRQTRLPDELIVCDDRSDDTTVEILRNFLATAPFPTKIHVNEKNLGSTKNFERAIALCTGDVIFLSDQDDIWDHEKIGQMASVFDRDEKIGMVFSDAEVVDESLRPTGRSLWDFTFPEEKRAAARSGSFLEVLLSQNVVTGATMAFRADFRQSFMPIPDNIPNSIHDNWISLVIASQARVEFLNRPLIKYRQHGTQQLGINFKVLETRTFDRRRNDYTTSIEFLKKEIARLEKLSEVLTGHPLLAEKLDGIDIDQIVQEKHGRILHLEARRNLPSARHRRVLRVIKEILSGRYRRFSNGLLSAGRDLMEK